MNLNLLNENERFYMNLLNQLQVSSEVINQLQNIQQQTEQLNQYTNIFYFPSHSLLNLYLIYNLINKIIS